MPTFKGQIDELKIWNYALTPEQVQAEYDAAPALPDTQELVLHYDFEDADNLGKDSSGKANHGTNHNTTQIEGRVGKA
ncbi:MAG: hypothetical protein Q4B28_03470 [bacterium]|nr:hypothetical protein [bacterium]